MKKHIILLALAAAAFAACEKPVPYETGAPMDLNGPNVYFSDANSIDLVLPSDVNTFEVEVCRENATDALSVPLKVLCGVDGAFVVPEKVEFASGADKAVVKVTTGENFDMFKEYQLTISIPEEYTHAYKPQETSPNIMLTVLQEDFVPYANGVFFCTFLDYVTGGKWPAWEQKLEYSAITDTYRFSNLWTPGSFLTFQWDKADKVTVGGSFPMGLDAGYGPLSAIPEKAEYDSENSTLVFYMDMYDSSSWGDLFAEYYQITELL